jgi:ComF family protein
MESGAGGDLFVPVPVHRDRARERGYDQAGLLAVAAATRLRLPIGFLLERRRPTVPQFQLDWAGRQENVAGAFGLAPGRHRGVHGRWVVLVDDVVTTGATLAACAGVLLEAGAAGVSAVTMARER